MLAVVLGLILTLAVSVGILALVALPHLRAGSRLLTPDGERTVQRARERSVSAALELRGRIGRARSTARSRYAPVSEYLHGRLDRLEAPSDAPADAATPRAAGRPAAPDLAAPDLAAPDLAAPDLAAPRPATTDVTAAPDATDVTAAPDATMAVPPGPRPSPAISGPIPNVAPDDDHHVPGDRVIDLRESADGPGAPVGGGAGGDSRRG